jgi:topoisomerase-4 subunit A
LVEKSSKAVEFIPEGEENQLELVSADWKPRIQINFRKRPGEEEATTEEVNVEEFISVKGLKAKGNTLTRETVNTIDPMDPIPYEPPTPEVQEPPSDDDDDGETPKEAEEAADSGETTTVELKVEDTSKAEEPKEQKLKPKKEEPKTPPSKDDSEGQLGLF